MLPKLWNHGDAFCSIRVFWASWPARSAAAASGGVWFFSCLASTLRATSGPTLPSRPCTKPLIRMALHQGA